MTTVRVVSWNIESLGDAKSTVTDPKTAAVNQSEIVNFINLVVRVTEADLVGIMELKSGIGATIRNWLLPRLNNGAPKKTRTSGRARSVPGRTAERRKRRCTCGRNRRAP